jgi:hypothetical protein
VRKGQGGGRPNERWRRTLKHVQQLAYPGLPNVKNFLCQHLHPTRRFPPVPPVPHPGTSASHCPARHRLSERAPVPSKGPWIRPDGAAARRGRSLNRSTGAAAHEVKPRLREAAHETIITPGANWFAW